MDYESAYKEIVQRVKELHEAGNALTRMQMEIICPELKDSEDERIRKKCIELIKRVIPSGNNQSSESKDILDCITYLEKQKEYNVPGYKTDDYFCEKCQENAFNAGKEAGLKEQKPAKWRPHDKEVLTKIKELIDSHFSEHEQREVYKDWLDEHISQPAEWSEEDRQMLHNCVDALREGGNGKAIVIDYNKHENWLHSLPKRFNLEPKQEWSEEDELMRDAVLNTLERIGDYGTIGMQKDWLKSLRPQPKQEWSKDWREEDIQTRFAFYTYKDDSSVLYLSNVFVEEASRNHGFGTRILRAAEKVAEVIGATTISLKVKQDSPANAWYRKNGYGYVTFEDGYDWLEKNLEYMKPYKQEWSKEDKRKLNRIYAILGTVADTHAYSTTCRLIGDKEATELQDFLRSIAKPLPHWRPSEEHNDDCVEAIGDKCPFLPKAFIDGANYQKEQMMKNSIDFDPNYLGPIDYIRLLDMGYNKEKGDKVKLIIVKDDDSNDNRTE